MDLNPKEYWMKQRVRNQNNEYISLFQGQKHRQASATTATSNATKCCRYLTHSTTRYELQDIPLHKYRITSAHTN